MRTVLHIGAARTWPAALGTRPWPLVPLGNRPLLEYWFELCADLGIADVHLILGDGADQIEHYADDGSQWGLRLHYSFLRNDHPSASFLTRSPDLWRDGLLFVSGPLFPRRRPDARPALPPDGGLHLYAGPHGSTAALCRNPADLDAFLAGRPGQPDAFAALGIDPVPVESIKDFFAINMQLAGGEMSRYLAPGYGAADGSCIGYNVIIPPSSQVAPTVIIGNNCRLAPLSSVGPCAVVGHHVAVDRGARLAHCVVLPGTYVGAQVELENKIASGSRLIDPEDGEFVDLRDTWLLAGVHPEGTTTDAARALLGWLAAVILLALQAIPFAILYALIRLAGLGRVETDIAHGRKERPLRLPTFRPAAQSLARLPVKLFRALCLDLTPRLAAVACGRLWLCGHEPLRQPEGNRLREQTPAYFPAAYSYSTPRSGTPDPLALDMDTRYYVHNRGLLEDIRILRDAYLGRLMSLFGTEHT